MKREIIDASKLELEDKVVAIKRVTKVVKGGRNSRVAALVVVGDRNGHVGVEDSYHFDEGVVRITSYTKRCSCRDVQGIHGGYSPGDRPGG